MSLYAWKKAAFSPTAVTIHDDRNVFGHHCWHFNRVPYRGGRGDV
jgi:hypothetical protein